MDAIEAKILLKNLLNRIKTTDDGSKQLATGTLYALNNQMTASTGTVTLRATFPNDNEALFPNEFVNVQLLVDTLHQAVLVPTAAVLPSFVQQSSAHVASKASAAVTPSSTLGAGNRLAGAAVGNEGHNVAAPRLGQRHDIGNH